jgi:hypothetical protein
MDMERAIRRIRGKRVEDNQPARQQSQNLFQVLHARIGSVVVMRDFGSQVVTGPLV